MNIIRVGILDDHQTIIDGYLHRLSSSPDIKIVFAVLFGEELEPALIMQPADVLLLDIHVATSSKNPNPYPILHLIPKLLQRYPSLNILIISMDFQRLLIKAVMEAGASGYILKDDQPSIQDLACIIRSVAREGIHLSPRIRKQFLPRENNDEGLLTPRQLEILSLSAAYPNASTSELANKMNVAHSTARNLLSGIYIKLNVTNRTAALIKARQLGLIPSESILTIDSQE